MSSGAVDRDAADPDAGSLELVHHHPGRLRLRSAAFLDGDAAAARAREALLGSGTVRAVAHDPRTGSLLVEYEPGLSAPDAIVERAARAAGAHCTVLFAPDAAGISVGDAMPAGAWQLVVKPIGAADLMAALRSLYGDDPEPLVAPELLGRRAA